MGGGDKDSCLEISVQMILKRGRVGRFGASAPNCLLGCQMSKHPTLGRNNVGTERHDSQRNDTQDNTNQYNGLITGP